ncbi:MAG TPA: methylmalonyl-CoA epimerase [Gemmatimonadales bacterium]|nr:methylmalonyl-CoA epimerase [Gemmatimonadales bacterium]
MADRPRIAHVGVAVEDLDAAIAFYRDVLGLEPHPPETADGATIVSLPFGESEVELLAPRSPESPIGRFLARRGPGIHHICYRVPDLDAALSACRSAGYRLIDETPRLGAAGRRIAFIHPKATAGILLELTE